MSETNVNATLPPKTCSVDRLVTKEEEVSKVLAGLKTACRRNGRYADIGETMDLQGTAFTVTNVYQQALGDLTPEHAKMEGHETVDEYRDSILAIHPGMPWLPQMKVWVHEFQKAE
ncbi:ASCH domain-containing protein [Paenibacillus qinlingensis]|uniref:ASCH domain-containing protein n=1 Tax=Paenibacillus qinlingensis TaxID=1837343 RepID=A0ABU1NSF6_9BACL|nr:ASCH domain-containing protein [Paenibacillus qinlingensis]MDR6549817.1 hypothetical protein [Paenibacillus qinlingensis]